MRNIIKIAAIIMAMMAPALADGARKMADGSTRIDGLTCRMTAVGKEVTAPCTMVSGGPRPDVTTIAFPDSGAMVGISRYPEPNRQFGEMFSGAAGQAPASLGTVTTGMMDSEWTCWVVPAAKLCVRP